MKAASGRPNNINARPPFLSAWLLLTLLALSVPLTTPMTRGATVQVQVGPGSPNFDPETVTIQRGDTVEWVFPNPEFSHTVTSGTHDNPDGLFASNVMNSGTFSHTFPDSGTFPYFCVLHWQMGMTGTVIVSTSGPPSVTRPLNIATRMRVQTGENILIGGFIITGNAPKKVIIRAVGPSLAAGGLSDLLADPVLELRGSNGLIASNDNWKDTQRTEIEATGVAPQNDLESALISTLSPGGYTALVSGKGGTTGVGVVEVYDLNQAADARLANISTRGFVQTGNNVMIGGFILGGGTGSANVIVRGLGPSLTQAGIAGAMSDPTLELRDGNGALVRGNDNWKDNQQSAIQATSIPPQNDLESAIVATLSPGPYTAILAGKGNQTGVGLVEVYLLP